jgi:hypothetical protein
MGSNFVYSRPPKNMNLEKEIIGEINKEIFNAKKLEFTNKFGNPVFKKRIGLMVFDRNNPQVDTRVRITNGKAEIMQKVIKADDGFGHSEKLEISIKIPDTKEAVFDAFQTYKNLLVNKYNEKLILLLVQTENYIWKTDDFELKLSYQFGKNDYFTFEIEALSENCDVSGAQKILGLNPTENHASPERKIFRATQVDLDASRMADKEILELINTYLSS